MAAQFETWLNVDLNTLPQVIPLTGMLFTADSGGNLIGAKVKKDGAAVALTGTVTGYVIRADDATITVSGSRSGNRASIVLPSSAYAVPGRIDIILRVTENGTKTVLCACRGMVVQSSTDTVLDPGHVIPSLEDLLAQIDATQAAASAANAAASNANAKASAANTAAGAANTAAGSANSAASAANAAAQTANAAASSATETAAAAAQTANAAAQTANAAAQNAPTAISGRTTVYQVSASGTEIPSGAWQGTLPTVPQGSFLWMKHTVTWNNGQETVLYSVARMGVDGAGSVSSVNNVSPDAQGNVALPLPESLGDLADDGRFVHTSGDAMTGNLTIVKANAGLYFKKTAAGDAVGGMYQVVDSGGHNRLVLQQRAEGSAATEGFFLPRPEAHDAFAAYGILTEKNLVTVAQGGTGASTTAQARTNLGLGSVLTDIFALQASDSAVRAIAKGGTGASTAAQARTNLGLGSALTDITALKNALGPHSFLRANVAKSGGKVYFTFSGACAFVIFCASAAADGRGLIFGYCNASGSVSANILSPSVSCLFSCAFGTNQLTVTNTSSAAIYATMMGTYGTMPALT